MLIEPANISKSESINLLSCKTMNVSVKALVKGLLETGATHPSYSWYDESVNSVHDLLCYAFDSARSFNFILNFLINVNLSS